MEVEKILWKMDNGDYDSLSMDDDGDCYSLSIEIVLDETNFSDLGWNIEGISNYRNFTFLLAIITSKAAVHDIAFRTFKKLQQIKMQE